MNDRFESETSPMILTRRNLLKRGAVALSAVALPPGVEAIGPVTRRDPVLVVLYLRGGADGLNLVVPHGDPFYYSARPTVQVPPGDELDLDGFFGLNPALSDLLPLYQGGELAIIHAVGSPDPTRSHFDAQDFMEKAAPGDKAITDGWLNRYLAELRSGDALTGISLRGTKVKAMLGPAPALAFSSIDGFSFTGAYQLERRAAFETRYELMAETLLGSSVQDAFTAIDTIADVPTDTDVIYPQGSALGRALKDAAALIKAQIGVRVIAIDLGGWDHHTSEIQRMETVGGDLAASLAAFHGDLATHANRTLTLCMTEFGRRVAQNGGGGTDHGHGGIMLACGGGIAGGRVITKDDQWPGLAPENLFMGQDLAATTDFRDVFAEVLSRHMGLANVDPVFPDYSPDPANVPGLYL